MTETTRPTESSVPAVVLFLAFDLGSTSWKLAFATGLGHRPRVVQIPARDLSRVWKETARAKLRLRLPADTLVRSCYEAGRDGFWLHRALIAQGVTNVVVDPSSIAVDRRARRVKTDRVDAIALVTQLIHANAGDRRGWREVHVPSPEIEAERQVLRERQTVRDARTAVWNRIQALLATQGVKLPLTCYDPRALRTVRMWDGNPLPDSLVARLEREWGQLDALTDRLKTLDKLRHERVAGQQDPIAQQTRQMTRLRGIGELGAMTLSAELFAWRGFRNAKQVGAIIGLTPTPYRSDQQVREQGISRSGNRRIRALAIEMAWNWVRWQPGSALTQWFRDRFGQHGRARKIGITALARKLVIALWRWVDQGVLPENAILNG